MHEMILCKLGEVVLKGLNRRSFEMKLMSNLRRRTARFGRFRVYSKQSTIYVEPAGEACDLDGAYDACKRVFGIIAVARALPCAKEKEAILDTAKTYLSSALTAARSFKVESRRADKTFPMTSIQLSQWVGGHLHEAFPHLTVDVHHPDLTVYVEVREEAAYVHAPAEPAAGGLPIGMGGRAVSLLSGGIPRRAALRHPPQVDDVADQIQPTAAQSGQEVGELGGMAMFGAEMDVGDEDRAPHRG